MLHPSTLSFTPTGRRVKILDKAVELLHSMLVLGLAADSTACKILLKALSESGKFADAEKISLMLEKKRFFLPAGYYDCCNISMFAKDMLLMRRPKLEKAAGGIGKPQIITKALSCFGDKYIYQCCEESSRLDQSGELHVPPQYVNEYCDGPCQKETNLVLHCLQGIFANFIFYNKATIGIIWDTIHEGCSYGPERGNFDVTKHLQADSALAAVFAHRVILSFASVVVGVIFIL
ncbi:hypothetical protein MLD38_023590 [Melastoma candidum]|uniref:Uncharacterized protein n=1 Tax=Melastoma candidum TaxID=119954 RepID=A0ACB9NQ58_9MYRT|nr:hypothetical protein MLD38_023590 [Melastoma candidum]